MKLLRTALLPLLACVPRQDGVTRLSLDTPVELAFGDQRLLVPLDRQHGYHLALAAPAGDFAELSASLCKLDSHQRLEEGDSHCLGQEVVVDAEGHSEVAIAPAADEADRHLGHLALHVFSEGRSPGPVTLRIDRQ